MANSLMDKYCGDQFWNTTLTWETYNPDLTKCFEKTVLVWVPCLFLWAFSGLEVYYIARSKYKDIPWNSLSMSKLFITIFLIIIVSLGDLASVIRRTHMDNSGVYYVDIYSPIIQILSFILSAILLVFNRRHGLRTSGLQFIFWFLVVLCSTPRFRTDIVHEEKSFPYYPYMGYMIYYPLTIFMFILNWFNDLPPKYSEYTSQEKPCPEDSASFISRLTFQWFDRLIWKGHKKTLEASDLWGIRNEDTAREVVPRFENYWKQAVDKIKRASEGFPKATYKNNSASVDFVDTSKKKEASIFPVMWKAFGGTFIFGVFLKVIQTALIFIGPQILNLLITFAENRKYQWRGYLYVFLLFANSSLQTLISSQYLQRMCIVGMRIRTAIIAAIYKKSLVMSNSAKKEATVGEMVNLMAVDAQTFLEIMPYINMVWYAPLEIVLALYFLWQILGPSVLAGLAVMIILMPMNGFVLAKRMSVLQMKQLTCKDERLKLMNEILSGIKVLKLYAWESSFEAQVKKIRKKEISALKSVAYVHAGTSFVATFAPYLVSLVTFATFVNVDEKNILTPQVAFVSLSLFGTMQFVMAAFPLVVIWATEASVSIKRINKFLNLEELNTENVQHDSSEKVPVVIENGTFSWGEEETVLKNINVKFEKGSLTAIVGVVGSGKSSLISAILGEMDKKSGRVNTTGDVAYVAQQAWMQNASIRDNILFGRTFNKSKYKKIIEACALKPDLKTLSAGDQTEIGEKGINVSGGQKQRISLARAIYTNSDIYLLDDPLSAVDSHVGKHIFEQVFGPNGLLKNTTRLLVTHSATYLPMVDNIVVLKEGQISEVGTYQELLDKKGEFSEFLTQYLNEVKESEVTEEPNQVTNRQRKPSQVSKSSEADSEKSEDNETAGEKLIEDEIAQEGNVKWRVYKQYFQSLGMLAVVAVILLNVLAQVFNISQNLWLSTWSVDEDVSSSKRDMYLGVYAGLGLAFVTTTFFAALVLFIGALNGATSLHNNLLTNILKAPCNTFFDITPVGRILNRFSQDIEAVDNTLPMMIKGFNLCFFGVLGTMFIICYTTPLFLLVLIPIACVYYLMQRFYVSTSRQLTRIEAISRPPIYSHFGETVSGASTIRAFGESDRFIRESEEKIDYNQMCNYPSIIASKWLAVRLEMIGNFVTLFAALLAVVDKNQNAGLVGLSIAYALQITQSLQLLVDSSSSIESNVVAVERIKEYTEVPHEAPWEIPDKTPAISWPDDGTVIFKDYALRYRDGLDLVLKNINFSIRGREKIGIIGRTGAGKSSLTVALFRIVEPTQGEILIDGINIATMGLHPLRSRLTIIPQDAVLFSGSLRMNLDPFEKHTDDEIWQVLEQAQLKDYVKGLTAGLNHEVTEGGENLSAGQRQLVCLSRALLRKSRILILDEATAAVDLETDDAVQKTIRNEFNDCTILTIAHRLNTIMDSDRVIVLDKGNIAEFDSPQNLLKNKESIFYSMAKDAGLV